MDRIATRFAKWLTCNCLQPTACVNRTWKKALSSVPVRLCKETQVLKERDGSGISSGTFAEARVSMQEGPVPGLKHEVGVSCANGSAPGHPPAGVSLKPKKSNFLIPCQRYSRTALLTNIITPSSAYPLPRLYNANTIPSRDRGRLRQCGVTCNRCLLMTMS